MRERYDVVAGLARSYLFEGLTVEQLEEHPVGDHAAKTVLVERAENLERDVQHPA